MLLAALPNAVRVILRAHIHHGLGALKCPNSAALSGRSDRLLVAQVVKLYVLQDVTFF